MKTFLHRHAHAWMIVLALIIALSVPTFAQLQDTDDDGDDAAQANQLVPYGAPGDSIPDNATIIDSAQFLNLLNQGTIKITTLRPGNQPDHSRKRLDRIHEVAIQTFLTQHPELTDLATLVANDPQQTKSVHRLTDNSWLLDLPDSSSVVTYGRSSKLTSVYNSILFSQDRDANLKLYTDLFNQLPGNYFETNNEIIYPESLTNAPLSDIKSAISSVTRNWRLILAYVPPPLVVAFTGCQAEIGAGVKNLTQGDRSLNLDYCSPTAKGIYNNFDFPNKNSNTCIKAQGYRGTCHAFAITSATELQIALKYQVKVNLSEQDLMEHYRLLWNPALQNESGDAFEEVVGMLNNNYHQPYENSWNYNPAFQQYVSNGVIKNSCAGYIPGEPCSANAPEAPMVCAFLSAVTNRAYCALQDAGIPGSPYSLANVGRFWDATDTEKSAESMVLALAFNSSVIATLNLSPGFQLAKNGYVPYDNDDLAAPSVGNHVVHVIGFISNDELTQKVPTAPQAVGGGYFIIKNSWNTCNGDGGYYYVPWAYMKARGLDGITISVQ